MAVALDPTTVQTPALDVIDRELVALADGAIDRLMVFMSPQEGKSVRVSHRFVEWLLEHDPDLRVAIVSYADEMARRWGSDIKLDAQSFNGDDDTIDLGLRLRADSRAAGRWQIDGRKGGVYCVGVAGALTGKPVDVMVIDDPIKDLEQAQSATYRERAWRFWQAVAVPRLGPGSRVVLVQTRWHENDMAGRLLEQDPDRWRVVSIPAVAESDDDPLGRRPGEAMQSARGNRDWAKIRSDVGEYVWCTPSETPILMADWTTRPISQVHVGDLVMGYAKGTREARMILTPTVVEAVGTRTAPVQTMRMESGATVRCTPDHRWYTGRNPDAPDIDRRNGGEVARPRPMYAPARVGTRLYRFDPVLPDLTPERQRLLDYLAGMIDGEGTWQDSALSIAQSPDANPEVFAKIEMVLKELGYSFQTKVRPHQNHPEWGRHGSFVINDPRGVAAEMLRRTDMAKSRQALAKLHARPHKPTRFRDRVEEITIEGDEPVYALRTGTGNYVAWGYASSNCALYQQRPAPADGGLFKRSGLRHWTKGAEQRLLLAGRTVDLRDCWRFLTVDLAASTKTSADYTAAAVWAIGVDGDLIMLDGIRERMDPAGHWPAVRALRERWSADVVFVESRMFGTTLVYEAGRDGVPVQELHADTDKVTRALPATARADSARLWFPPEDRFPAWGDWRDELLAFPNGSHDDCVDVVAYAARVAGAHWLPTEASVQVDARRASRDDGVAEQAYAAATGGSSGLDFMSVNY
jgi:predicted phage terminase large subunit-like protein